MSLCRKHGVERNRVFDGDPRFPTGRSECPICEREKAAAKSARQSRRLRPRPDHVSPHQRRNP